MDKSRIYRSVLGISAAAYVVGALFKIMHWPFAGIIVVVALTAIAISSVLYFSSKLEKSYIDQLAIVGIPLWAAHTLLRLTRAPYQSEIRIGLFVIALLYVGYLVFKWYRDDKSKGIRGINLERSSFVLGAILVAVGALFKIQHWPLAGPILISGLCVLCMNFLLSMFSKGDKD